MADAGDPNLGRREFVQGAVSGAALAAVPGVVLAEIGRASCRERVSV